MPHNHIFVFPCTIFVRFGTFFTHFSTPRRRTTTTTNLLLGPLSAARGQKPENHQPKFYITWSKCLFKTLEQLEMIINFRPLAVKYEVLVPSKFIALVIIVIKSWIPQRSLQRFGGKNLLRLAFSLVDAIITLVPIGYFPNRQSTCNYAWCEKALEKKTYLQLPWFAPLDLSCGFFVHFLVIYVSFEIIP